MFPINSDTNVLEDEFFVSNLIKKIPSNKSHIERIKEINSYEMFDEDISNELFMERYYLLLKLTFSKEKKVWGEYDWVSQNAKKPVLFLKAMAIPLSKVAVVKLIDDLTDRFFDRLVGSKRRLELRGKRVPMRFNDDRSAHFNPRFTEIKFFNGGDWRFGYNGVFCAETVFHEFSHLLDSARGKKTNILAHDQLFVDYLEMVLYEFRIWIKTKYKMNNHINQILLNDELVLQWEIDEKQFLQNLKNEKKEIQKNLLRYEQEKAKEKGLKENEYPLDLILKEEQETILNYVFDILTRYKEIGRNIPVVNKTRKLIKDNGQNSILDKQQLDVLVDAMNYVNMNEIVSNQSMLNQSKYKQILRSFLLDLEGFKRGVISRNLPESGRIQ